MLTSNDLLDSRAEISRDKVCFMMKVYGKTDDRAKLLDICNTKYTHDFKSIKSYGKEHFYKIKEVKEIFSNSLYSIFVGKANDYLENCMFDTSESCYYRMVFENNIEDRFGITLPQATRALNLDVEYKAYKENFDLYEEGRTSNGNNIYLYTTSLEYNAPSLNTSNHSGIKDFELKFFKDYLDCEYDFCDDI